VDDRDVVQQPDAHLLGREIPDRRQLRDLREEAVAVGKRPVGALGDALLGLYLARGWILRQRRSRVVSVTPKGAEKFGSLFGV
jgi:hypothetical protein